MNPALSVRRQIAENLRRMESDQLEYIAFQLKKAAKREFFKFMKEERVFL
jgi:hypothetical protein